jgi:hypothetical protein
VTFIGGGVRQVGFGAFMALAPHRFIDTKLQHRVPVEERERRQAFFGGLLVLAGLLEILAGLA